MRVWPGTPYPLGATWDGEGVNFAIFSELATGVKLCLFDRPDDAKPPRIGEVVRRRPAGELEQLVEHVARNRLGPESLVSAPASNCLWDIHALEARSWKPKVES